ncbi:hypothetical protein FNV43_RR16085 [Rhamnella rubrinervis]|uniref:Uncharacterized protein n=1 Tax=Rhamnella rubrinervis TaxID=2594499 RepID=A0A8K0EA51_9ROSA|nr:hypothetical protein FNV43_RR16085 [Rhamnella rubrinervis]
MGAIWLVNLDSGSSIKILNWIPAALQMPELGLIDHSGLDSAVYLRIYLIRLRIFIPIACLAFAVMVPVNWTNGTLKIFIPIACLAFAFMVPVSWTNSTLDCSNNLTRRNVDKLSISNIPIGSHREYKKFATMRLQFLQSERQRPDQFTVFVKNVPPDPDESTGFLGLWGNRMDAIDFYTSEIRRISEEIPMEGDKITNSPKSIMPAAFVSFKSRWVAAVCAQTRQSKNPTIWLTEWAPKPCDIYWDNLAISYASLSIRRPINAAAFFFRTFFFTIPIASLQSLASSSIKILNWIPAALQMPELGLIDHSGLNSAVYLRIYLIRLHAP